MQKLIECVPNFSEGRDPARIEALVTAAASIPGAWVLHVHSDADHNRTVITLAGQPQAVAEAALRGVGKAAELIDLNKHHGAHPRIGATDVLPFVPVEGVTMDCCVALAHQTGRRIWERYHIPVYFYEAAALRPERRALENIRRGQFESLRNEISHHPNRAPDVGGTESHPTAGAIAVGARKFLIAFNVDLDTADVSLAREIARTIRTSGGGLPALKALGIALPSRGISQVTMNLTDFEQTSLEQAYTAVQYEAQRRGCRIIGTEIVGLLPRRALDQISDRFRSVIKVLPDQILEHHLAVLMNQNEKESASVS
jgi:glutamate formiminotransferase